jgi:CheY-like chemotaxis protein
MEKTVLLVEDNADNRIIYATCLEAAGFRVIEAIRGEAGLELARQKTPDLVLMDLHLPGLSGVEAARTLRQDPATSTIPIVMITATPGALRFEEACWDEVIAKPVDPIEVREAVQRLLA